MFDKIKDAIKIFKKLEKLYFVHESCYIDDNVEIGEGTKIWHFCHIMGKTRIGKNCSI
jgi:UDP-2-acetamido-3-amino-2,3-dideoxy-glucuronate N-acetyltransferase